jgi:peptidoglycan/LPS O-acetylase OafA/YrhL
VSTPIQFSLRANPKLGYLPALDGLRGIAILAVMLYHFHSKPLIPGGGIVGVDLFFVLSGFLITTLLLQEWARSGDISLRRFYLRRVLRLAPALTCFVLIYLLITVAFHRYEFTARPSTTLVLIDLAAVATYSINWVHAFGSSGMLGFSHLWSLSIEEQFYLIWPLSLLTLLRLRASVLLIVTFTLAVIVCSAMLPYILEEPRNRFYYGTDFRLQTLLMGALLGQLYVSGVLRSAIVQLASFRIALAGSIAFLATTALLATNRTVFLFDGGHTAVAISAALLTMACMFQPTTFFANLISNRLLVYVGQRSYALYIWHVAIGSWLRAYDPVPQVVIAAVLTFVAAELSHRLVEAPALRLKSRLRASSPETAQPARFATTELDPSAAA